ncbi:type I-F CRISPR-associated protein Csy3, partial [Candidatus Parcubacteria bacterium]
MTKTKLEIATVLAFERKLDPSDALFYSGIWGDQEKAQAWRPVAIQEKSVRGTVSNRLKNEDQDPAKLDADIQNPNLQTVDVATLPPEADTLRVRFSLRVLPRAGTPSACNNIHYRRALEEAVGEYVKSQGFTELSHRYAHNLANGRFLWRNLLCAEEVEVLVRHVHRGEAK